MAQPLFKLVILLVAINTLLYIGGVRIIGDDSSNLLDNFIEINKTGDGQAVVSPDLIDKLPTTFKQSASGISDFVDSIGAVGKFIAFIVNIVFTPLGLFTSAGMPLNIVLLIGLPLMVGLFLAVAYFIRSGG